MSNQKNILHILSALQVGGLEKLLIDFIKANKDKNLNYIVTVMNDRVDESLKKELLNTGCTIYFMNRKQGHLHPKYIFELLSIIKKHNIDIIHTHNSGGKWWSILCKILIPKLKLVYTIHDSIIIKNIKGLGKVLHKNFIDINISISNEIEKNCLELGIYRSRVKKIYNGVDIKKLGLLKKGRRHHDRVKLLNIARVTHTKKGQDILLYALAECKKQGLKVQCDFVGGVSDMESFSYLQSLTSELELHNEVEFLGNQNNIAQRLAEADIFILPSRYEGMPISILEAMAAHVPVIASNISGSNDIINNNKNGLLFESENYEDLANSITTLYNNKELSDKLANKAYDDIKNFDISIMSKQYNQVYKNLSANDKRSPNETA